MKISTFVQRIEQILPPVWMKICKEGCGKILRPTRKDSQINSAIWSFWELDRSRTFQHPCYIVENLSNF